MKLSHISPGSPTYWPSDLNKIPDVIDFCGTKGVGNHAVTAESCLDLSSDHSPIILTMANQFKPTASKPFLHNIKTDWFQFRDLVENGINVNIPLRHLDDIECAIEDFNFIVQNAAWNSTANITIKPNRKKKSGNKVDKPRKEKD